MELFPADPAANILPHDGSAIYHGPVIASVEASDLLLILHEKIPWQHDETLIFGKRIVTSRKVAWFADGGQSYAYSGTVKQAHIWTPELLRLKDICERITSSTYNSCLLNLYHSGAEGMGWHSDNEKTILPDSSIASISLGAERKFSFKHKTTKQTLSIVLEHGSLLDMRDQTQRHWLHQMPKTTRITTPRINLTFRKMVD